MKKYVDVSLSVPREEHEVYFKTMAGQSNIKRPQDSPLFLAIKEGDLSLVQSLLENGDTLGTNRFTPFLVACYYGHLDIAKALYQESDLNKPDVHKNTPLMLAVWNGHKDIIQWLLNLGADVNLQNIDGDTVLHLALKFEHPHVAHLLLNVEDIDSNKTNHMSYTPFVIAVVREYMDIAKQLCCEHDSDLNAQYTENNALIHMCALSGSDNALSWLMGKEVDFNLKNSQGYTALNLAAYKGHLPSVKLLIEPLIRDKHLKDIVELAVVNAGINGHADVIEYLLPLSKNYHSVFIQFMFMEAVIKNHWPVIEHLMNINPKKNESYLNKHYNYGEFPFNDKSTLLHAAAYKGHVDIFKNLHELSAEISSLNKNKDTVLHAAIEGGHIEMVRYICSLGVDVNAINKQGNSPLHLAVKMNSEEMSKCLMMFGANPELKNKSHETPVVLAVSHPSISSCIQKIQALDFEDFDLPYIHQLVTKKEDKIILQYFKNIQDFNAKNNEGQTAIEFAAHHGFLPPLIVLLLIEAKGDRQEAMNHVEVLKEVRHKHERAYQSLCKAKEEIPRISEDRLEGIRQLLEAGRCLHMKETGSKSSSISSSTNLRFFAISSESDSDFEPHFSSENELTSSCSI